MISFAELGLPKEVCQVLAKDGINSPFPIQAAAIPDALNGRDILGRGPTGSGKTFTFGLPMLTLLAKNGHSTPGRPRGLVLAPTRELATQITERLDPCAAALGLRVVEIVGGENIKAQIRRLAAPCDLLIATPGRAIDLMERGNLILDKVQVTALDEADHMADMGFIPQVKKLLDRTPKDGQRLLFSATLDGDVDKLVRRYLHNPATHSTAAVEANVDTMKHYRLLVGGPESRNRILIQIAGRLGRTIMFMRTKRGVDRQVKRLRAAGINAIGLHGDKGQGGRRNAIDGFTSGDIPVLVATDIAARGIDIAGVDLVVHVDPPAEHKAYLHRAGRTARAGASGVVVTCVMENQVEDVEALMKKAGVDAPVVDVRNDPRALKKITGAVAPSGIALPPVGNKPVVAKDTGARRRQKKNPAWEHPRAQARSSKQDPRKKKRRVRVTRHEK